MVVEEVFSTRSGGRQLVVTPFDDWCSNLKVDVFRALGDVEALCQAMTGQEKSEWTEREAEAFEKIRARLLNMAGAVGRLPQTLRIDAEEEQQ